MKIINVKCEGNDILKFYNFLAWNVEETNESFKERETKRKEGQSLSRRLDRIRENVAVAD